MLGGKYSQDRDTSLFSLNLNRSSHDLIRSGRRGQAADIDISVGAVGTALP